MILLEFVDKNQAIDQIIDYCNKENASKLLDSISSVRSFPDDVTVIKLIVDVVNSLGITRKDIIDFQNGILETDDSSILLNIDRFAHARNIFDIVKNLQLSRMKTDHRDVLHKFATDLFDRVKDANIDDIKKFIKEILNRLNEEDLQDINNKLFPAESEVTSSEEHTESDEEVSQEQTQSGETETGESQ